MTSLFDGDSLISKRSKTMKQVLLSVAGYDPTSGAGILLDIRTFIKMGFHGIGIVTALTAQNTERVKDIFFPPPGFLEEQYHTLTADMEISGMKVGMLGSQENIPVIAQILSENPGIPVVVDPVIRSSSGYPLLDNEDLFAYTEAIGPKANLLTPNIHEAKLLSGMDIKDTSDMKKVAERIFQTTSVPCLLKGGHLKDQPTDVLYDGEKFTLFANDRIDKAVHGTGCFLSSSLLGYLVLDHPIRKACKLAINDTADAIKKAVPIGHGQHIIQTCP
jgi:hydroxymethylpyrimidine/phosphomethylpyrimidine kinase